MERRFIQILAGGLIGRQAGRLVITSAPVLLGPGGKPPPVWGRGFAGCRHHALRRVTERSERCAPSEDTYEQIYYF